MINPTLRVIKRLCSGLSTGLFILSICIHLNFLPESYKPYGMPCVVFGWVILLSGWFINDDIGDINDKS